MEYNLTKEECEIIDFLRKDFRTRNIVKSRINGTGVAIFWSIIDITEWADDRYPEHNIDDEAAKDILNQIFHHHDAEYGITWLHIDTAIWDWLYVNQPEILDLKNTVDEK